MQSPRIRLLTIIIVLAVLAPMGWVAGPAQAQDTDSDDTSTSQLWLTYQLHKPLNERQWGFQVEGRSNAPDEPDKWKSLEGRAHLNFYPESWLTAFPETILRYTLENDDINSFLVNVRGGVRFSLPSTQDLFHRERVALSRFQPGILLRLEWRNFWYSDGSSDHSWRGRVRLEFQVPINHRSMGTNRTLYARTDFEAFIPLGDDAEETFSNRLRLRFGLGYRYIYNWRFEVLGIWQESRDTISDVDTTDVFMLNLRLRHYI